MLKPFALDALPSVIALPLKEYLEEPRPVLRLWHACDVIELLLRLLVMVGLADLRRHGELPEALLKELRTRIEEPTLGKWKGMALAVAKHLNNSHTVVPGLPDFVHKVLLPFLDGPGDARPRTVETSFSALRNQLAHGGGVTQTVGSRLLTAWEAPFATVIQEAAWLIGLDLVVRQPNGEFGVLRGPMTQATPYAFSDLNALLVAISSEDEVVIVCDEVVLPLWPLKLYGPPRLCDPDMPAAREAAPLIYVRRGEICLQFTPVGSDEACQSEGDETTLNAFRALFHLDEADAAAQQKSFVVRGFETDMYKDAERLVGRTTELEILRSAVVAMTDGVLWLPGVAGVGKSYLVARLTADLLDAPPAQTLVLPYRFRAGDDRCSRESFLQFAIERLEAWSLLPPATCEAASGEQQPRPLAKLRELLGRLQGQRVLFILDGLDEIAERDPDFGHSVLAMRENCVMWLCAGRPERGLQEVFSIDDCVHPFPLGLPPMGRGDIRTMLLEKIGPLRKRLLKNDREDSEQIINPFIEKVVEAADGLPLYVTYLVGDILRNRFRALDAGEHLPESLEAYHEELLGRCAVGTLHQVLTPLAATLVAASEPLTVEMLAVLMRRRTLVPDGVRGEQLVQQGISSIASMLRRVATPEGDQGYTLFHHSLRQHMCESETTRDAVELARAALCDYCGDWQKHENRYALRHYAEHLYAAKLHDELFYLARNESFRRKQADVFPENPELALRTIQLALQAAAEKDNAGAMAEFVISHTRQLSAIISRSPLDLLRQVNLQRAWELADLNEACPLVLWYLLIAWELKESDRVEQARITLERLLQKRLTQQPFGWGECCTYLLCKLSDVSEDAVISLQMQLLYPEQQADLSEYLANKNCFLAARETADSIVGDFLKSKAYKRLVKAMVKAGEVDSATELVQSLENNRDRASLLTVIALVQIETGEVILGKQTLDAAMKLLQDNGDCDTGSVLGEIAIAWVKANEIDRGMQIALSMNRNSHCRSKTLREVVEIQIAKGRENAALEIAQNMHDDLCRTEALVAIAEAQARAGTTGTAMQTLDAAKKTVRGERERRRILECVASAQARLGEMSEAMKTATSCDKDSTGKLIAVQLRSGATDAARHNFTVVLKAQVTECRYGQVRLFTAIAIAQTEIGAVDVADRAFHMALEWAQSIVDNSDRENALSEIATGQAEANKIDAAWRTLQDIESDYGRSEALCAIAKAQAKAGYFDAAIQIALDINHLKLRETVFSQVAVALAQTGKMDLASEMAYGNDITHNTLRGEVISVLAVTCAKEGQIPYARRCAENVVLFGRRNAQNTFYEGAALCAIAIAQAEAGDIDAAYETAQQITSEFYKSEAFRGLALVQAASGRIDAAERTAEESVKLIQNISRESKLDLVAAAEYFAKTYDRENFKKLLLPCSFFSEVAYKMCGLISRLYPDQANDMLEGGEKVL